MVDTVTIPTLELQAAMIQSGGNKSKAAEILGIHRQTLMKLLSEKLTTTRYVVTSAVNNTKVFAPFWKALQYYCDENEAELIVIPTRYKNPSAMRMTDPIWYDSAIMSHFCEVERELNSQVIVMGDVPIQPTASDPLSSLDPHAKGKWAIFGHPQIEMRMVPARMDSTPPMLHTTGSVSEKSYSASKLGKKAQLHHTYGAVVIECVGDKAYVRELVSNDSGEFYDVAGGVKKYSPKGIEELLRIPALVTGDEHIANSSERVMNATYYNKDSITAIARPEEIYRHDVLDFFSRNHHHTDPIQNFVKYLQGTDDVKAEVESTIRKIEETTPADSVSYLVGSNHNEALGRWMKESNPKVDPKNARFFHELSSVVYRLAEEKLTHKIDPFEVYAREIMGLADRVKFLGRNEGRTVEGVEVSYHGDKGANGARGSLTTFAKSSSKTVTGHTHGPGIKKGAWGVGHSTDGLDYQSGLSNWFNTHCLIYPNGKRQLIHVLSDGTWRAS